MGEPARPFRDTALGASNELLTGRFYGLNLVGEDDPGEVGASILEDDTSEFTALAQGEAASVDSVQAITVVPESVAVDAKTVRAILDTKNSSIPHDRIVKLIRLAWTDRDVFNNRPVPGHLIGLVPEDPAEWYHENHTHVEELITASRNAKDPRRYDLEFLVEETEAFADTSFLRNAIRITRLSQHHPEAERAEYTARAILAEAQREFSR